MKFSYFTFLLFTVLIAFSCNKDSLITENTSNDFHEIAIDDLNSSIFDNDANSVFSLRNGTQKINDNQTNDDLTRGVRVRIPLFSSEPVNVDLGSWVTVQFSLQDDLTPVSDVCPDNISQEHINTIMEDSESFIEDGDVRLLFNGEEIDVLSNLRSDRITTYKYTSDGNCRYILPYRFYLNPQSKGDYELTFWLEGIEYSRTISWVKKEKPTK